MNQQKFLNILVLLFTFSQVNAFWWGSSSSRQEEEEDPIKKIPVHVLRTLTYHPVLIPNNPVGPPPPINPFQYSRGFLSQYPGNPPIMNPYGPGNNNNYNAYQTIPPSPSPTPSSTSTTQRVTTTTPPQTTTTTTLPTSTTTEATTTFQPLPPAQMTTTQQDQVPQMTGKIHAKSPLVGNRYSDMPYEYFNGASHMAASAKGQDPYNLQYVTNIAPMNVQFVPCMCPVEVRINPNDQLPIMDTKSSDDSMLESIVNDLDENLE